MSDDTMPKNADEELLAKLGYKQELSRTWSGFSNFAISFSIISILAGCFTTFGQGFNNGGPVAISWGWPIVSAFILLIGFTMSELVSAYPTSGGIYWWAAKMGGPRAGFFTGWLNLIGLVAVTASVAYGCATFIDLTLSTFSTGFAEGYSLTRVFLIFVIVLALASLLNIFSGHLMAIMNNVSVWWHVVGALAIVLILVFLPDGHQSFSYVFTERFNNSGYDGGSTSGMTYWLLVMPFGLLLTQYTITGFDASAHLSEETTAASEGAAKGIWRSIFYSAIGGWILLLAFLFAVPDNAAGDPDNAGVGANGVAYIFTSVLDTNVAGTVLLISAVGQFFCSTACMTSASRMTFAFSRDKAIPGSSLWSKVNPRTKVPANAVLLVAVVAALITLPALVEVNIGTEEDPLIVPTAFYAVVSVAVIGLYLAFLIPIWLRWRMGDDFQPGSWTNGSKYKWMNIIAVAEIAIICIYFILPFVPAGNPFNDEFSWKFVNYAPILTLGSLAVLAVWWAVSAKHWFTGPQVTIDKAVVEAFDE
ncbi:amino acid permease [Nocardioides sp. cx-173]|uniref:amino acid permease n=1 Tax=Nocardioides sp. cx-173 TaxID=2898796 RepID=UPI001E534FAA|nr:amino acid permease [Nocardioides sp. cx-173]MCD4525813.1 amino acid permease [Nocardioides sp. cx-173]UGB39968.1 amino acid permease [Nocardioides sp. cx-173]